MFCSRCCIQSCVWMFACDWKKAHISFEILQQLFSVGSRGKLECYLPYNNTIDEQVPPVVIALFLTSLWLHYLLRMNFFPHPPGQSNISWLRRPLSAQARFKTLLSWEDNKKKKLEASCRLGDRCEGNPINCALERYYAIFNKVQTNSGRMDNEKKSHFPSFLV